MASKEYYEVVVEVDLTVKVKFTEKVFQETQTKGWQDNFYDIDSRFELAQMFAYNAVFNGVTDMRRLDGFADGFDQDDIQVIFGDYSIDRE